MRQRAVGTEHKRLYRRAAPLPVKGAAGRQAGPPLFALVVFLYFVQNLAYSFKLKKLAYADVACIALGFVLRVE